PVAGAGLGDDDDVVDGGRRVGGEPPDRDLGGFFDFDGPVTVDDGDDGEAPVRAPHRRRGGADTGGLLPERQRQVAGGGVRRLHASSFAEMVAMGNSPPRSSGTEKLA